MSIPWFIGQAGAQHPAEVARALAYAATHGAEGIVSVSDMRVLAAATPNNTVRVMSGGAILLNKSPGGAGQSYVDRIGSQDVLSIPSTSSAGGRSDLIVRTVEDPQYPPHSVPANPASGPYGFTRRFPVPAGTTSVDVLNLGYPAIALARIDIPASTATITQAMITDLRKVAAPQRTRDTYTRSPITATSLTSATYVDFPQQIAVDALIPAWAAKAIIRADLLDVVHQVANVDGNLTIQLGSGSEAQALHSQRRYDKTWNGSTSRHDLTIVAEYTLRQAIRGTTQRIKIQGTRLNGTGRLHADLNTQVFWDIEFMEEAG